MRDPLQKRGKSAGSFLGGCREGFWLCQGDSIVLSFLVVVVVDYYKRDTVGF